MFLSLSFPQHSQPISSPPPPNTHTYTHTPQLAHALFLLLLSIYWRFYGYVPWLTLLCFTFFSPQELIKNTERNDEDRPDLEMALEAMQVRQGRPAGWSQRHSCFEKAYDYSQSNERDMLVTLLSISLWQRSSVCSCHCYAIYLRTLLARWQFFIGASMAVSL